MINRHAVIRTLLFSLLSIGRVSQSVQSLSHVPLFATPWTTACQASLTITNSWSLLKLMSESVMPSSHLILCYPLLLPPSIFLSIRVSSSESALRIRCPKYWSFILILSPSNEYSGLLLSSFVPFVYILHISDIVYLSFSYRLPSNDSLWSIQVTVNGSLFLFAAE